MKEPIFVYEPEDLLVFESKKDAELYLEPYDVGTYEIFDAKGKRLNVTLTGDNMTLIHERRVQITDCINFGDASSKLRTVLIEFLVYHGYENFSLENLSLEELVQKSVIYKTK